MLRVTLSVYPDDYILAVRAAKRFQDTKRQRFLEINYENGQTYNVQQLWDINGAYLYVTRSK